MKTNPLELSFEYPRPMWISRDPELFDDITMFDLTLRTTIHYFKNHDTGYETFLVCLLGFGLRLERKERK